MKLHDNPRITLVGAGPGDPELISIKGMKAIQSADAILYDALAGKELLDYAPDHCTKLNVGKRGGCISHQQSTINELLVHCAYKYGHVVRLKGGDPFVFGRGYEEVIYTQKHGIQTTVIPGISSSISVPALEGIPLTVRGINESFWVTTATLSTGELSNDIKLAASSSATVVILMGLQKIEEIMQLFKQNGKEHLPVAVIQNGSLASQKAVLGHVNSIVDEVKQQQIASPAIIVVGEVVKLHKNFEREAFLQMVMQSVK
ncbi:MAG TPA: uroporphyrinogen-III C-methyltransferase [Cytophagaceae bacterium]|jgi:uroporphyrin-III C-methyltransferase|nr:uroporphyrinogen-III C-methyltransferase [Cytophagaceae bacterium]